MTMRNYLLLTAAIAVSAIVTAQQPVPVGSGSYAEYTPLVKSKTDQHGGDKSRIMETRRVYISESKQGEPIPTNDWWTNLLVDTYSGAVELSAGGESRRQRHFCGASKPLEQRWL